MAESNYIASFVKNNRARQKLTQEQLAQKAGVGLRFIRDLEQGKATLRTDKINQVLAMFGYSLIPGRQLDPYQVHADHVNKEVKIYLRNRSVLNGVIIDQVREGMEIKGWKFISSNNLKEYKSTKNKELVQDISHDQIERIENITT